MVGVYLPHPKSRSFVFSWPRWRVEGHEHSTLHGFVLPESFGVGRPTPSYPLSDNISCQDGLSHSVQILGWYMIRMSEPLLLSEPNHLMSIPLLLLSGNTSPLLTGKFLIRRLCAAFQTGCSHFVLGGSHFLCGCVPLWYQYSYLCSFRASNCQRPPRTALKSACPLCHRPLFSPVLGLPHFCILTSYLLL